MKSRSILQDSNCNEKYQFVFENYHVLRIQCAPPTQCFPSFNVRKGNVYSRTKTTECVITAVYQQ